MNRFHNGHTEQFPIYDNNCSGHELDISPIQRQISTGHYTQSYSMIENDDLGEDDEFDQFRPKTNDLSMVFMTMVNEGLRIDDESFKYHRTQHAPEFDAEPIQEPLTFQHIMVGLEGEEMPVDIIQEDQQPKDTQPYFSEKDQVTVELQLCELQPSPDQQSVEFTKETLIGYCQRLAQQRRVTDSIIVEPKLHHNKVFVWCFREYAVPLEELAKEGHVSTQSLVKQVRELMDKHKLTEIHTSNLAYSFRLGRYVLDYLHSPAPGRQLTATNCEVVARSFASIPEIKVQVGEYVLSSAVFSHKINDSVLTGRLIPVLDPQDEYLVGSGAYGKIFMSRDKPSTVKKRIFYTPYVHSNCRSESINELCMLSVCAGFVSAEVQLMEIRETNRFFEFEMERCLPIHDVKIDPQLLDKMCCTLVENVQKMHLLHIYHRDIKPQNILYSKRLDGLVLIDFGLSLHTTRTYPGNKQFTVYCGTAKYMSDEMKQLKNEGCGFLDLAKSDMVALQKSINDIKQKNTANSQPVADLHRVYADRSQFNEILKGLIYNKSIPNNRGLKGSIFTKLMKLGLEGMAQKIISSLANLVGPEELFEIVRLAIKHRLTVFDLAGLKNLLKKLMNAKEEDYFKELVVEHEILTSPIPKAIQKCREYINRPQGTWVAKRCLLYQLVQNIWMYQQQNKFSDIMAVLPELLQLFNPADGQTELNVALLQLVEAAMRNSDTAQSELPRQLKALADPLIAKIEIVEGDYPNTSNALHRIVENMLFRETAKVEEINAREAFNVKDMNRYAVEQRHLRKVLLEMFNNNCENELVLLQTLDSIFLHENGIAQPIRYSYPLNQTIVEEVSTIIPPLHDVQCYPALLNVSLPEEYIISTRNILLIDYKPYAIGLTTLRVIAGDLEVSLNYRAATINPVEAQHVTVLLRGEDILAKVVTYGFRHEVLEDNTDGTTLPIFGNETLSQQQQKARDQQIQTFCRDFAVMKVLSLNSLGPKLLTLLGCDFIIYPNCIRYLVVASQPAVVGQDKSQQCEQDLKAAIQLLHTHKIVLRNICPSNVAFDPFTKRFIFNNFQKARGITDKPTSGNPSDPVKSYTEVCGTESCMGQQMKQLVEDHKLTGTVNLFLNDLEAIQHTVGLLQQQDESFSPPEMLGSNNLNHIEFLLKMVLSEETGHAKWVLQTVSRYLNRRPNFFQKSLQKEYLWSEGPAAFDSAMETIENSLKDKYSLQRMSFRRNLLSDQFFATISSQAYSLVILDLSHNGLTSLTVETIEGLDLPVLKELRLYDNCLGDSAFNLFQCNLPGLVELNIGCNQIVKCSLKGKPAKTNQLSRLDLSWNEITLDSSLVSLLMSLRLDQLNLEFTNVTMEQATIKHLCRKQQCPFGSKSVWLSMTHNGNTKSTLLSFVNDLLTLQYLTQLPDGLLNCNSGSFACDRVEGVEGELTQTMRKAKRPVEDSQQQ